MDLADFRNQIDEIDQELMALFRRRMETVEQIAAYKEQHGLPVYDPQREEEKRTALLAQLPPALRDDAGALLTCLFTLPPRAATPPCRAAAASWAGGWPTATPLPFTLAWALTNTGFFSGNRRNWKSFCGKGPGMG